MKVKDAIRQEKDAKWQVFIAIKHYNIGVKFKARGLDPARHTFHPACETIWHIFNTFNANGQELISTENRYITAILMQCKS